ncbi:MAG TPA: TadE/TadG family type IV pilus assembly protein [Candidatus Sulfotelmatobacter sp.]|jgi:Flp pilus assembly protein TadG|nr:TadE/TadG family type IV pilus assembly protein [Candidatus Sulfotelmatobacter sp.]
MRAPLPVLRFWAGTGGIAATEFALILPLLVLGWLGMAQLAQLTEASAKTHMVAQSLSDLSTQKTTPALTDLVAAAQQILSPLPATTSVLTIDMVGISYDSSGVASQSWRCSSPSGLATGVSLASAVGLGSSGQGVIMVTVKYSYTPTITGGILGAQTFTATSLNTSRLGGLPAKPC